MSDLTDIITHASGPWEQPPGSATSNLQTTSLCGFTGSVWGMQHKTLLGTREFPGATQVSSPVFSVDPSFVNCSDCLNHRNWNLWVLERTEL